MELLLSTYPALAPLGLLGVALLGLRHPGARPVPVLRAARWASTLAILVAAGACATLALHGPVTSPVLGVGDFGLSLRIDALSVTMLTLVAFMGGVVLRFSRNYLDGDPRHGLFVGRMALTVACVMLLVLSGNLVHLSLFWALTSFALHRLLLFYPDRVGAVIAARKKFIVARAGDVALAAAALLLYRVFDTVDLATLLERAGSLEPGAAGAALPAAALLVVLSAILKSAQFPTHGWLAEVMETPTPVSALLHAGIINGGTFLVVRLGAAMVLAPGALHVLLIVGGFTAVFGSVVLVTQDSVKAALAYSSAAHMGFMLFLCGLGAFPVAILHLVAHSFYKAHAFLSSGSTVETLRVKADPGVAPGVAGILGGAAAAVLTVLAVGALVGVDVLERPVATGLAAVLAIGLTQLWVVGMGHLGSLVVLGRTVAAAAATTLAFFLLEMGAAAVLSDAVPETETGPATLALMGGVVVVFALVVVAQLRLPAFAATPAGGALWVHLRNGLYANALYDRLVGALRVRPASPSST